MNKEQTLARLKEIAERATAISVEMRAEGASVETLSSEVDKLSAEKRSLETQLKVIEIEEGEEVRKLGGFNPTKKTEKREDEDKFDTAEYRSEFMAFCKTGKVPTEMRADAYSNTTELSAVIPTTIMNEIISKMTKYGQLFAKVRKMNVKGGVNFPILSLKPTATWITEATPSDRKKITANTSVSFSYFGLECKVATSLLAEEVKLPGFENTIVALVAEAMTKAIDIAIIKGAGTTEPVGIAVDTRVPAGQIITLTSAEFTEWDSWKKKVFAKIPLGYRAGGEFIMSAGTFEGYIDGMVDANGQPVGRTNYGIADGPQERFGGKPVTLVEDDVVASYDAAAVTDVVAVFVNLSDYGINSNMQMQMFRYLDQDLNQWVDKAILIADGKLIDPNGVIIVKKGA